jgi:phosphinothricin acetyltransferase
MRTSVTAIRPAEASDLAGTVDVYNHYVANSHCTFDVEPFSAADRLGWWDQFDGDRCQCWVAADNHEVLGYACSTRLKPKRAYETSVEVSAYVHPDHTGRGLGRKLYECLFTALADKDVHRAYALIALPNDPSLALHKAFGFEEVSHLTEVGRKFDRYWDVVWLERAC